MVSSRRRQQQESRYRRRAQGADSASDEGGSSSDGLEEEDIEELGAASEESSEEESVGRRVGTPRLRIDGDRIGLLSRQAEFTEYTGLDLPARTRTVSISQAMERRLRALTAEAPSFNCGWLAPGTAFVGSTYAPEYRLLPMAADLRVASSVTVAAFDARLRTVHGTIAARRCVLSDDSGSLRLEPRGGVEEEIWFSGEIFDPSRYGATNREVHNMYIEWVKRFYDGLEIDLKAKEFRMRYVPMKWTCVSSVDSKSFEMLAVLKKDDGCLAGTTEAPGLAMVVAPKCPFASPVYEFR